VVFRLQDVDEGAVFPLQFDGNPFIGIKTMAYVSSISMGE